MMDALHILAIAQNTLVALCYMLLSWQLWRSYRQNSAAQRSLGALIIIFGLSSVCGYLIHVFPPSPAVEVARTIFMFPLAITLVWFAGRREVLQIVSALDRDDAAASILKKSRAARGVTD